MGLSEYLLTYKYCTQRRLCVCARTFSLYKWLHQSRLNEAFGSSRGHLVQTHTENSTEVCRCVCVCLIEITGEK